MKWQNLQVRRCPKCGSSLEHEERKRVLVCTSCDFKITARTFLSMLEDREGPVVERIHPDASPEIRCQLEALKNS